MNVTVIVGLRDTSADRWRSTLWRFVRERLEIDHPDFEIVVGTDDGVDPFHKTLALNRAAAQASGDVLMLTDADTWTPPAALREAVAAVERDPGRWCRPYTWKIKLLEQATLRALEAGPGAWTWEFDPKGRYEGKTPYWAAPPFVLHRDLWDDIGGADLRFDRGWGHEDEALARSLKVLHGDPLVIEGQAVHLWHPRIGRSGRDFWQGQDAGKPAHLRLLQEYVRARTPKLMRELIAAREGAGVGR